MTLQKLVTSLLGLALLAVSGAGVTHWRASAREAAAEAAYPPEGQLLTIEGRQIHAVMRGEGPDLVLIHGSSGSVRDFTFGLMPELIKRYRVIAIDRPGLGYSEDHPESADIVVQARLMQATAAALGAERPVVLGQSYGGAIALAWAVNFPDTLAALVPVSAPSHEWGTPLPTYYKVLSHPLGQIFAVPLLTAFVPKIKVMEAVEEVFVPQASPAGYAEHFGPGLTLRRESLRANARQRAALEPQIVELSARYGFLQIPIEIVHGTADDTVSARIHAERLVQDAPQANLTLLPGIGHMPHQVATEAVIAAIDRAATRAGLRGSGK